MADDKQCFFVESPDGRKFKMVIRGDLGRLSVSKIRRYLGNYGVQDDCFLSFNGVDLTNDMVGDDFGLQNNSVLQISYDEPIAEPNEEEGDMRYTPEPARGPAPGPAQHQSPPHKAAPVRPQDAWGYHDHGPESDLRAQLARLEAEKAELERKVQALSSQSPQAVPATAGNALRTGQKAASPSRGGSGFTDPLSAAQENLRVLSEDLGLPLQFDANGTCVLNGETRATSGLGDGGLSLFISYDAQTQRVVLYTTLLTQLPLDNPVLLSKLYEVLLEGALLGREVCGGGIGLSKESELVVLQTSFSAYHCDSTTLRDTVPVFVETVRRWRGLIDELLE